MSDFRSVLMCAWFLSVLSLGALFWGSCGDGDENHLFLGLMEIIPTQIANQWKIIANMTGNIFKTTIYSHLVCTSSSRVPPSVQSTTPLVFGTVMATFFFQLQHVWTLPIMLVNFNHLQYWQNKKRLWNHLGERGYGQPVSIHHFWRDFALYWHWHRFLSVKIPNFRNNKTFSITTSLPHKKMGELPSSKLTWQ